MKLFKKAGFSDVKETVVCRKSVIKFPVDDSCLDVLLSGGGIRKDLKVSPRDGWGSLCSKRVREGGETADVVRGSERPLGWWVITCEKQELDCELKILKGNIFLYVVSL